MFYLFVVLLLFLPGYGMIMPITKSDGTLDVSSLLSHIALLEQSVEESKSLTVKTAQLESQLQTVLVDLKTAQGELKKTQGELQTTQDELREVKSDLKSTQATVAVLQFQLKSGTSQCSCNVTTPMKLQLSTNISSLNADVSRLKTDVHQLQSQRNFTGYAGGTYYDAKASSATILCLPEHPIYAEHSSSSHHAKIYGTEYEAPSGTPFQNLYNEDMPCVVCESETKTSVIMVPARNQCYPGWKLEYSGYLMGAYDIYASAEFICVDKDPEVIPGGQDNKQGQALLIVESKCRSLPCPPYVDNWELTCSLCTK